MYDVSSEVSKMVATALADDLNASLVENEKLTIENEEMKKLKERNQKLKYRVKNRRNVVMTQRKEINNLKEINKQQTLKLQRIRAQYSYNFQRRRNAEDKLQRSDAMFNEQERLMGEMCNEMDELKREVNDVKAENEYLRLLVDNNEVILYDEEAKVYLPSTQKCVYELLNYNVSLSNVSPVISTVLKLANLHPNKLPCKSTVNNMNIQRLLLAQKQLSETLQEKEETCLLSDETSKYGKKIEGFHVRDKEGNMMVLGLREMATKSGSDTLTTFQNILDDINNVSRCSENEVSQKILLNIVSTMSDRAATQKKFNELLEEYRRLVMMEDLGQAWIEMSEAEQLSISKISNFFCGLHALVHIADAAPKSLQEVDNILFENEPPIFDKSYKSKQEAGSVRLIRTASKGFSCGGDEKSGVYGPFHLFVKDFLKEINLRSVPIQRFHGNRFNILFSSAANIFFMRDI